ncbi:Twin-arginine translocation protein TatA [invertebrate metagenome]|uniref:Twin-arginine translocation protein TatA n=1 Tax=invertebrate metagenome TaxID=1711999 RepID=A0A484H963_9ZZZZ
MGSWSIGHWIVVLLVILLLFGAGKIPHLMGDMARGIKAFKKGMKEEEEGAASPSPSEEPKVLLREQTANTSEMQKDSRNIVHS